MNDRIPLPSKDQIRASKDVVYLDALLKEVERVIAKIEVDLTFLTDDEDWHSRARSALAAHQICKKYLVAHIRHLTKGSPDPVETQAQQQLAKAMKKEAKAKSLEERNKAAKITAEQKTVNAQNRAITLIERTSFLAAFQRAAMRHLTPEQFNAICEDAERSTLKGITQEITNHHSPAEQAA